MLSWIAEADALAVSAISCWEVAMLARKRRIELSMTIGEWIDEAPAFTDRVELAAWTNSYLRKKEF